MKLTTPSKSSDVADKLSMKGHFTAIRGTDMSKSKSEIDFETPMAGPSETPKRFSKPRGQKGVQAFLDELGCCVCGRPDADASKVRVTHLWKHYYNYTCPHGLGNTRVNATIRQAAINAGLVKEEDTNG